MGFDPWYFQRWALEQKLGNATRKLILFAIAVQAESNTGWCFAAQDDLGEYAECSTRTVGTHLKAMEAAGLIGRQRRFSDAGRRLADGFLLLAPGVSEWPDGSQIAPPAKSSGEPPEEIASGNPTSSPPEAQASEQERPSRTAPQKRDDARTSARESLPEDFPEHLKPHARIVFKVLRQVAAEHNSKAVTPLALGRIMMARPRKPFVKAAHDMAAWSASARRQIKDVVATYRTWLDKEDDIEGGEQLGDDGAPRNGPSGGGPNMGGRGGRRDSVSDLLNALGD